MTAPRPHAPAVPAASPWASSLLGRALLGCALLAGCTSVGAEPPRASPPGATRSESSAPAIGRDRGEAIFAGGCFWCEETAFEGVPGVSAVVSGYVGGTKKNPTYEEVSSGSTGHAEAVKVTYDPAKISYAKLLEIFWHNVDPLSAGGQFCDRGNQYRSGIFYLDDQQRKEAEASKQKLMNSKQFPQPIVTEVTLAGDFYPAEDYHQDFYKKSPVRYQSYRLGCGRDRRLKELWGSAAGH